MDYWHKKTELDQDFTWSLPEQKTGVLQIIGGNIHNFASVAKTTEEASSLNLKEIRLLLPDALKKKLPPLDNLSFAKSTDSGSFAKSDELSAAFDGADLTLLAGDLSKNSATSVAILDNLKTTTKPVVIARDSVDLITPEIGPVLEKENATIICSMAQLQKIFRSVYYPKMILLSMPILPVVETLHKFTLSYPCTILTFHQGQVITAKDGQVISTPLEKTTYTPITLWSGTLAVKIAALQIWQPNKYLEATSSAVLFTNKS